MAPQDRQSRRKAPPVKLFQKGPPRPPSGLQPAMSRTADRQDSEPEECDLSLSDRAEDAAPRSIRIDEGTVRALLYGYEAFPVQHDQLCARSGSCGARAVSQDRASGGVVARVRDASGLVGGSTRPCRTPRSARTRCPMSAPSAHISPRRAKRWPTGQRHRQCQKASTRRKRTRVTTGYTIRPRPVRIASCGGRQPA